MHGTGALTTAAHGDCSRSTSGRTRLASLAFLRQRQLPVHRRLLPVAAEHIRFLMTLTAANIVVPSIADFRKVLESIDCKHWQIKPPYDLEHLYRNRKDLCSLNVQVFCNGRGVIIQPTSKGPGSTHGSLIWMDCALPGSFKGRKLPNGWLLGDSRCA